MRTEKLNYYLPPELIAQHPADVRSDSKLLVLNRSGGELSDSQFSRIGDFLLPGDCLVLNDTKVLPARFFAQRVSGGKLEGLFLAESKPGVWEVMLKGLGRLKPNESIYLKDRTRKDFCQAVLLDKIGQGRCRLKIETDADAETILDKIGFPPLPPYIKRINNTTEAAIDKVRYQTVYARWPGAVAAPTAGLHLTNQLIKQLKNSQIHFAYITLHVGAGTFRPITTENIEEHEIHQERFSIDEENARIINATKNKGDQIIAVGTTSVRALETAAAGSQVKATSGTTKLFIKPGYKFKITDAMVTNFHLPKST
ncbi:unnamed protein product, partial [marine sediment metagenome]